MQQQLDALIKHSTRYQTSADLWGQPLPAELSDVFSMSGAVSFHPGRREVHVHLTDAPLLMQNQKLRDAFYMRTGHYYRTTSDLEKAPVGSSEHVVLSEGSLLWVPGEDGTPRAAMTQRSRTNPKTGEMVLSPEAWQNPRGKTQDNQTYMTELGEELLVMREVDKAAGQIGLTSLLICFNGKPTVTPQEKQEQLTIYEAHLNKTRGAEQPFKAAGVGVSLQEATLHEPDLAACWKIVTYINNHKVREVPGLPLFTRETNSFEFSVPLILDGVSTKGMQLVAMEPGPQQPVSFMTRDELMAMPLAAKKPQSGDVIGGLNQALFGPLRGLNMDDQIHLYNRQHRKFFDTNKMPKVA